MLSTLVKLRKFERPLSLNANVTEQFRIARHVFLAAAPVGALVGASVAAYDWVVNVLLWGPFLQAFPPLVLCLLPIPGMFLTGVILHWFRVPTSSMADEVVLAYHKPETGIDYKSALPKLAASVATMGFGGSAGMEGSSKWLGATISSFVQHWLNRIGGLRWLHGRVETMLLAGAAAGVGAIFHAPLTGAIMCIESPYKHDFARESLIHGLIAAATGYAMFTLFRPAGSDFPIHFTYQLNARDLAICVPLGLAGGLTSHLFLGLLGRLRRAWGRWGAPRVVKTTAGGVVVSAIALATYAATGAPLSLQAGLPVANQLLNGEFTLATIFVIFAAKLLATAFTFGSGGVGGLFAPSATIGAAMGAAFDAIFLPSQPGVFTLIGIAAFTGASYNSLLFAAVFVAEASGSPALVVPSLIASCVAFLVSAGISNSESQRHRRTADDGVLTGLPCKNWMTTQLVVTHPDESIAAFMERTVYEHSFQALPVVEEDGSFRGMVCRKAVKGIAKEEWLTTTVSAIMDRTARTVYADQPMSLVERELALGQQDYLPVIDRSTGRLVGMLSSSDVHRARQQPATRQ